MSGDDEYEEYIDQALARYLNLLPGASSPLVMKITREIARDIIDGVLPQGSAIDSINLAERFGTSRTPIREALIALEHQGLVTIQANRRPRVFDPSVEQVIEIYEFRAELHALTARKVARRATVDQLQELGRHVAQMQQAASADDVGRFFWANVAFHAAMTDVAADGTLQRTVEGLGLRTLRLRRLGVTLPGRMSRALSDNERLLLAFSDRDEELAGVLGRSLILRALDGLRVVLGGVEQPRSR